MAKCIDCEYYNPDANVSVACKIHMCWPHGAYCTEFKQTTIQHNPQEDKPLNIIERIGTPAALEQLAEECCELGQAALKLARKLRGENPTPKTLEDCTSAVQEEMADVLVCMGVLGETGMFGGIDGIDKIADEKQQRWQKRLSEVKK